MRPIRRSGGKTKDARCNEPGKALAFYPNLSHAVRFVADQPPIPTTRGSMRKALWVEGFKIFATVVEE